MDQDASLLPTRNFLKSVHPYDSLPEPDMTRIAAAFRRLEYAAGKAIYDIGDPLAGLYLVKRGTVEVLDVTGAVVSILGARNSFGERGLLRDGLAATSARATEVSVILCLPLAELQGLIADFPAFERFFGRGRSTEGRTSDLNTQKISALVARSPVTIPTTTTILVAAAMMRDDHVSSLGVTEGDRFVGIVTTRDLAAKALANGMDPQRPVADIMTRDPVSLPLDALGSDVLHTMLERHIGHIPVVEDGHLIGMVTQTDLTRFQATSAAGLVRDAAEAESIAELAKATRGIPQLLSHLVAANTAHEIVTRLITDVADTVTRRLLALAEAELGPPRVSYLWLACGSQGRQEQSGLTDQDNCLILDDSATDADMPYFQRLAKFVSDGLDACGYVYCPGDMMATNPQWCQPLRVWREYFRGWVAQPDPKAQLLASVMFDLRPIGGDVALFRNLQSETFAMASRNSIFVAHMIGNSLTHQPPLGLLRGFATIRAGVHKNQIDLKHNGVAPVVELARAYALIGELTAANTRARLLAAQRAGVISASGGRDLIEAYDMIAETRLQNQAREIRSGKPPDNFMAPGELSDFERSHLRDAFVVVRTMQSALGQSRGVRL